MFLDSTLYLYLNFGSTNKRLGVLYAFFRVNILREKMRKQEADLKAGRETERDKHGGALIGLSQLDIETSDKICWECCYVIIVLIRDVSVYAADDARSKIQTARFSIKTRNPICYRLFTSNALRNWTCKFRHVPETNKRRGLIKTLITCNSICRPRYQFFPSFGSIWQVNSLIS